jgi:DNA ligase D-like protein (predicted 3'-phosphoesterase)
VGLREYQEKRDFSKTSEPPGKIGGEEERRFVVQRHQARQLHYDFRLEMGGVLRSWAVPKGPPLESGIRRLAVQVEDHPLDYIDFAGEIPVGEYGGGSVEIWDKGTFDLEKETADRLEFSLRGIRLSGSYVLVHTGGRNWLLLRRKGR